MREAINQQAVAVPKRVAGRDRSRPRSILLANAGATETDRSGSLAVRTAGLPLLLYSSRWTGARLNGRAAPFEDEVGPSHSRSDKGEKR